VSGAHARHASAVSSRCVARVTRRAPARPASFKPHGDGDALDGLNRARSVPGDEAYVRHPLALPPSAGRRVASGIVAEFGPAQQSKTR